MSVSGGSSIRGGGGGVELTHLSTALPTAKASWSASVRPAVLLSLSRGAPWQRTPWRWHLSMSTENVDWGRIPLAEAIDHVKMTLLKLRGYKPGRLMTVPEDLVQVFESMIERDPDKGAEILKAGFKARLAELYHQWQALRISTVPLCSTPGRQSMGAD